MSIPCIAPHSFQNFSLTWTFAASSQPTVMLRYDTKTRHTFNLWEGQAELDQERLSVGDGSLLIHKPEVEEHSGTYICTFSGLQSKHIVRTKVNITVLAISEYFWVDVNSRNKGGKAATEQKCVCSAGADEQTTQRSWWSTVASAAFFLSTIIIALPQCVRQRGMMINLSDTITPAMTKE